MNYYKDYERLINDYACMSEVNRMMWRENLIGAIHALMNFKRDVECEMMSKGTLSGVMRLFDDRIEAYDRVLAEIHRRYANENKEE